MASVSNNGIVIFYRNTRTIHRRQFPIFTVPYTRFYKCMLITFLRDLKHVSFIANKNSFLVYCIWSPCSLLTCLLHLYTLQLVKFYTLLHYLCDFLSSNTSSCCEIVEARPQNKSNETFHAADIMHYAFIFAVSLQISVREPWA